MNTLKKIIAIVSVMLSILIANNTFATTQNDSLVKANTFYANKQYQQALELYLDLYKSGYTSATLNYNIGCSYFKTNDFVRAILFFERAKLLNPNNDDINFNLEVARARQVDKLDVIPEFFLKKWINTIANTLSSNSWIIIAVLSLIVSLLFLYMFFFASSVALKRTHFGLAFSLLIFTVVFIWFSSEQKKSQTIRTDAIVLTPSVTAKSSPDDAGTNLFVIHEGLKVTIETGVGDWIRIRLSNGTVGWLKKSDIEVI